MSLYGPQYKDEQGNIVDLPINAKKLDGYTYNEYSKYYTTSSTTENAFLVTIPYVKALSDGLVIHCQFHTATKSGATLNVNSLGAKGIYYRYATAITTHIVANNYVDLIYSATLDKWVLLFSYDANSDTLGYQVRTNNGSYYNGASTSCYRYQILVETNDGLEAFTSTSNNTGTSKTQLSPKYIPDGTIRYYSGTATVNSSAKFSSTALWQQYQGINLKYSFNIGTITKDSPCYIKMSRNTDGTLSPVYSATSGGHPLVFALPTTKDGYYYTYLGRTYEASSVVYLELELCHPTFYYDGGIRVYDGTYLYDWAKASTKPSYTAGEVGALPSTTTYIKSASASGNTLTITPSSGSALTYTPTIFDFTGVISTQEITIKNLQTGIYLLTYNGTKKIHTAIGEVSNHELVLETSTTYNNILIANRYTVTSGNNTLSFILWKLMCPFSNNILYKGCTYQTEGSGTIYWTGQVYQERFIEESMYISYNGASSSDEHYYYPLYRDTVIEYDDGSGQTKNTYSLLKTGPKYAGGTAVTLNGTNKGSNTASFYAPTTVGTSGQFLKSNGSGAPTWTGLSDVATSGSYNDLIGTPIPGDSGEIKTKYRCAFNGYTGSGNPIWYYKLVKLPVDNAGNYASAIINGRIGGWLSNNMSSIYCLIWNRDEIGFALLDLGGTGTMLDIFDTADLVAYKNSDNTVDIYIKCKGYFTFDLDVEVYQSSASITYDGSHIATTPSGTESGKASTSTSRLQLEKGVLKVNGDDVITSSKSAVDSGIDLSLVTTGEKYTWNNKQDKISALGSTTKPVYFSSDGVASACSTYAGGTAITLNGTSKAASTASFYAPTSVGTNGQLLSSNGSSLVWTDDNRGLLHHDLTKTIDNTTTDSGWSMFNDTYNGFLLKSLRFQANSPDWGIGDFGSGIVFGGVDTKGVISLSYRYSKIKFAGGNSSSGIVWWIELDGTSGKSYNLDDIATKQSKKVTGSWTVSTSNPGPMVDIILEHPNIKIYYMTYVSGTRTTTVSSVLFYVSYNEIQSMYTLTLSYLNASGSLTKINSGKIYYEYFE